MTCWAVTMVAVVVAFGIRCGSSILVVKMTTVVLVSIMVCKMMAVVRVTIAVIVVMIAMRQ